MAVVNGYVHQQARILIVDDEQSDRDFLQRLLLRGGFDDIHAFSSGQEALQAYEALDPDLVLLDVHMPGMDGYEVLQIMRQNHRSNVYLPILMLTGAHEARERALELGASDFLTKPGNATEILLRVRNFLATRALSRAMSDRNVDLEARVRERTGELEELQVEIIERLAMVGEHRDDATGEHTARVGQLSGRIAKQMGLAEAVVKLVPMAARLHDLGKVSIPDAVLLKPGKLTPSEFAVVQTHCMAGAKILSDSCTPLLQMAERIAAHHHERYDGNGYPSGLAGDSIPMEARIVAVADVFDALTHERPYKEAWPVDAAVAEIRAQSGSQFDPEVVEAFLAISDATA